MLPRPLVAAPAPGRVRHLHLTVDVLAGAIRLCGDLDRSSAYHLADAVSALRSSPSRIWTIDLLDVSFCDVEGLRVLHRARESARRSGRGLHLTCVRPALADLLALFGTVPGSDAVVRPRAVAAVAAAS